MVYKLNLPPLEDCILDGVDEKYFQRKDNFQYLKVEPKTIFKSNLLTLKNLPWHLVLIFLRKHGDQGLPHIDNTDPKNITTWGINWIYKGHGFMDYWEHEDFNSSDVDSIVDKSASSILVYNQSKPPRIRYQMLPGAYLVNTSKVHNAIGFQTRYAISYRCTVYNIPWEGIIDMFSDLIVEENIAISI